MIAEARFPALPMLELCAGAGRAHQAANILLGERRVVTVGQWDFDARLDAVLRKGYSCEELAPVHTGPEDSDILRLQPDDLPRAFFVPFGRPCRVPAVVQAQKPASRAGTSCGRQLPNVRRREKGLLQHRKVPNAVTQMSPRRRHLTQMSCFQNTRVHTS